MLGKIIGNYQITSELAQGGMGAVYRGRHQSLPRDVVVKSILLSSFPPSLQSQLKARFVREAYIQSQLDHPNVVRVYEFFTTSENYYLVMEFVDGMSLRDLIKRQGALSPAHAVPLFKQALSALDYAHNFNYVDESGNRNRGVVHRDIKPANMLLDGMARLKITDFGIVKLAGERGMTRTGFNPGTVEYMSPEQIRGLEVDARSDIYSMGVTFYEALTGRLPFPHSETGSEYDVLRGHIELTPPPITTIKPDAPAALASAIMRSLEKDPNARFQSGAEFLEAILDYERGDGSLIKEAVRVEAAAAPARVPQATHSMTEVISYDTRQAPITAPVAPPAPAKPSLTTQIIEPAPTNHRDATPKPAPPPRRYGLIVAGAIVALIVAAGAFMFWKQTGAPSSAAANISANDPATASSPAAPSPAQTTGASPAAPEDARLQQGREAEAQERYADAIKGYAEYLQQNAQAPDAATLQTRVDQLKKLQGLLNLADVEMKNRDYSAAKLDYAEALKLRPDSRLAQAGLAAAESRRTAR
jgi:serine/threonine-protein kinase